MQQQEERRYFIHDYRKTRGTKSLAYDQWKSKTSELTKNMMIVKWYAFRSPVMALGPFGSCFMQLSSISPFAFFTVIFLPLVFLAFVDPYCLFLYLFLVAVFAIYYRFWNRNLRIEHGFVVFELQNDKNQVVYVSLEKLRGGILFQIAEKVDTVRDYSDGATRGTVHMISSSETLGFYAMLVSTVSMDLVLQSEKMLDAYYNLLKSNCQHTVSNLLDFMNDNSLQLKFRIPGSEESVALNDYKALTFVERLYPMWRYGRVHKFPQISAPFAFHVEGLPLPRLPEGRLLLMKQRILNCLLEEKNFEFLKGRRAVFLKLDKESLKARLNETNLQEHPSAVTIIDHLSNFWSELLDIAAVFEGLGVAIFHFPEDDNRDHVLDVERKTELVSKIGSFSNIGENSIFVLTVTITDGRDGRNDRNDGDEMDDEDEINDLDEMDERFQPGEFGEDSVSVYMITLADARDSGKYRNDDENVGGNVLVKQGKFGRKIDVSLPCDISDLELKQSLAKSMKALVDSSAQTFLSKVRGFAYHHPDKPLQNFTAKLFLLQTMRNVDFLIHKRIVKQEFGPDEFCVWTPKQEQIINEAREIFERVERPMIQWLVQGCYGSGKTLLLMQLVKEFLKSGNKGNVFIRIGTSYERLESLIFSHISANGWEERVTVGSQPESFDDVSLFLWDEFILYANLLPFQEELLFKLRNSNPSVVLFTSQLETKLEMRMRSNGDSIGWMTNISMKSLGGNLRSSVEISNMTQKLQQHFVNDTWPPGEPVVSKLLWRSGQPTITSFHDNSDDRSIFLRDCIMRIKKLAETQREVMAVPLAHASFRAKLKDQCKDLVNVSFETRDEILGYQYQCVIVVLDLASCGFLLRSLIEVMTRATTSLHFIINSSLEPFTILEMPSIRHDYCLTHDVESRVRALIANVASVGNKVWIYDRFDVLEASFVEEIREAAEVEKRDLNDFVTGMEMEEKSKKFSLIIELMPYKTRVLSSGFWYAYFPPVIAIKSFDDDDDLRRRKNDIMYDLERHRKGILKFFMSYLKEGDEGGDGRKKD